MTRAAKIEETTSPVRASHEHNNLNHEDTFWEGVSLVRSWPVRHRDWPIYRPFEPGLPVESLVRSGLGRAWRFSGLTWVLQAANPYTRDSANSGCNDRVFGNLVCILVHQAACLFRADHQQSALSDIYRTQSRWLGFYTRATSRRPGHRAGALPWSLVTGLHE